MPELLPQKTLLLVELPDFQRTRTRWHESDLYQIWREPSVQAWLQKPLARLPTDGRRSQDPGRFSPARADARFPRADLDREQRTKVDRRFSFRSIPGRGAKIRRATGDGFPGENGERETRDNRLRAARDRDGQAYRISSSHASTIINGCFASNDVATLKALLDRVDHRRKKADGSLQESEAFAAAAKHLPAEYAGMIFLDPRPFVEKLMPLIAMTGQSLPMNQLQPTKAGAQRGGDGRLRPRKNARNRFCRDAAGGRGGKVEAAPPRHCGSGHVSLLNVASSLVR